MRISSSLGAPWGIIVTSLHALLRLLVLWILSRRHAPLQAGHPVTEQPKPGLSDSEIRGKASAASSFAHFARSMRATGCTVLFDHLIGEQLHRVGTARPSALAVLVLI